MKIKNVTKFLLIPIVSSSKIWASSKLEASFSMSHCSVEATITPDSVEGHFTEVW